MKEVAVCPCGQTPKALFIRDNGQGIKWASVCGDCCGEWAIEFRTQYKPFNSDECMALAIDAWNDAPRSRPAVEADAGELCRYCGAGELSPCSPGCPNTDKYDRTA